MRKTDEILDRPYRDNGAYRVPEGYFSTLNKRIIDALPEDKPQRKGIRITFLPRMKYAAAACISVAIMGAGALALHLNNPGNKAEPAMAKAQQEEITEEYVKEFMDYAMVDNNDVYLYLAEQQ